MTGHSARACRGAHRAPRPRGLENLPGWVKSDYDARSVVCEHKHDNLTFA